MSETDKLIAWIKGMAALLAFGAVIIIVWNILTFFLLQFLGYRYYGISINTTISALLIPFVTLAPIFYGFHAHAPIIGIAISVPLVLAALVCLRIEADVWRREN